MKNLYFRLYDLKNNIMIYPDFYLGKNTDLISLYISGKINDDDSDFQYQYKIMQYINYDIKYNNIIQKIFEGDIFQFGTDEEFDKGDGERGIIKFNKSSSQYVFIFYSVAGGEGNGEIYRHINKGKFIGNIFENVELYNKYTDIEL